MKYFPRPSSTDEWFDPEQLLAMGAAFDHACASLELRDANGLGATLVARKLIEVARFGERDAARMHETVMQWVCAD